MNQQRQTVRQQATQAFAESLAQLQETFDGDGEGDLLADVPPAPRPSPDDADSDQSVSVVSAIEPILRQRVK